MRQLAVTGLHKAFGAHPVLTGVDLEVPAGSLTAILGPSGSGKTTLLRLLVGFERADAGTITIGDTMVDGKGVHLAPERRRIGYVPQEGSLFPHLTVAANVGFGLPAKERRGGKAEALLETVGLDGLGKRYPHQLSGGQQQRVALARALAIKPAVVLLDEPFASLDAHLRASVRADVQQIFRDSGTTAILVTHDQDEALSVADRVAVLRDGKIAQYASPEELYSRPADPELASFIGDANLLDGQLAAGNVDTILGSLAIVSHNGIGASPTGPATVLVRPEQIELRLDRDDPDGDSPHGDGPEGDGPEGDGAEEDGAEGGGLRARIVSYGYHGHDAVVLVRPVSARSAQDPDAQVIRVRVMGGHDYPVSSLVTLHTRGPVLVWPRGV